MKKYLLPAMLAASQLLLALEFPVFPEKFIRPMVGFEKWQCGKTAILTEQGRAYAYTSAITGNFAAEKFRFFNVKLEAAGDVAGATAQSVKIAKDRSLDLTLRLANGSNAARLMAASGKKADAVALIKDMLKEDNGKNSAAFANLRQQLNLLESKTK